jgi:putative flippase GtrA
MFGRTRVVHFLLAGSAGFTFDAALLTALVNGLGWSPYAARAVSFPLALAITWLLNRTLTFRDRPSTGAGLELMRYAIVQLGGAAVNYGVFFTLVTLSAAAAMCLTYLGMHYFAFPRARLDTAHD